MAALAKDPASAGRARTSSRPPSRPFALSSTPATGRTPPPSCRSRCRRRWTRRDRAHGWRRRAATARGEGAQAAPLADVHDRADDAGPAALLLYLALSGLLAADKVEVPRVTGKQLVQARACAREGRLQGQARRGPQQRRPRHGRRPGPGRRHAGGRELDRGRWRCRTVPGTSACRPSGSCRRPRPCAS